MFKRGIRWLVLLMTLALVLGGCQAVGGVDLDKLLINGMKQTAYQAKQTVTIDLNLPDVGEEPLLNLFRSIKIDMTDIRSKDVNNMSARGSIQIGNGSIPFLAVVKDEVMLWQLEGLTRPLLIQEDEWLAEDEELLGMFDPYMMQNLQETVLPNVIKHLPNPQRLTVDRATEAVNGEMLELWRVHAEISGTEIPALIKAFVDGLLSDPESLAVIADVYVQAALGMDASELFGMDVTPLIQMMLAELSAELDEALASEEVAFLFTDNNYIRMDLYVDNDLNLRKSNLELAIDLPETPSNADIKVTVATEIWNVGGNIVLEEISADGAIDINAPDADKQFLLSLDRQSPLFHFLVNELRINQTQIVMPVSPGLPQPGEVRPFIDPATSSTMVPVRYVTEELDAEVHWNGETRQVTIIDIWSGKTIVLTIDSNIAVVDGVPVELTAKAQLYNGTTYVPVRFIMEQFGTTVHWDQETWTVIISR